MNDALVKISEAERALEAAADIYEMLDLRDKAMAYSVLAEARGFGEAAQKAKIFQLKAERKAGNWLAENISVGNPILTNKPTLGELEIDDHESTRWQLQAALPEEQFNEWVDECIERDREITAVALRREANKYLGKETYPNISPNPAEHVEFGFWALPRPLTKGWGSGDVFRRLCEEVATPDAAFGVTDGIPSDILGIDKKTGYEWRTLPFQDSQFKFGYWDPPYDKMYKQEGIEIWRTCKKLAILHTHIYPRSWLENAARVGMYAVTMGPMKRIRCLQVFDKVEEIGSSS